MSRWNSEDSDEGRLPEGMERVGYDADTQIYSYRDQDGSDWEGEPGARYGQLHRSGDRGYQRLSTVNEETIRQGNREAWRYMLPFFLMVLVVLLALYRFLGSTVNAPAPLLCPDHSIRYVVKPGDSCWAITNERGFIVDDLTKLNPGMDCSQLKAGAEICIPVNE